MTGFEARLRKYLTVQGVALVKFEKSLIPSPDGLDWCAFAEKEGFATSLRLGADSLGIMGFAPFVAEQICRDLETLGATV